MAAGPRSLLMCGVAGIALVSALAPGRAGAQTSNETMQREIRRRDAVIDELLRRVDALERQVRAQAQERSVPPPRTVAGASPTPRTTAVAAPLAIAPPRGMATAPRLEAQAQTVPGGGTTGTTGTTGETSDEVIARALENTLINQGGQLLPPYAVQFVPDFGFTYQSLYQLSFVANNTIVTQRSHRYLAELGLGVRVGLPWETQLTVRVPFGWDHGDATFAGTTNRSSNRSGLGDIFVGLQKQVLHESGMIPDVLLNIGYKANTGSSSLSETQVSTFPFGVGTGSGFNNLIAGVTALKRQDPLVFLGAINYIHSFPATIGGANQQLGDAFEFRFSPILAASPDTSLRLAWDTTFQADGKFLGRNVPGSSQVISFLEVGVGSVITPKLFLDAAIQIGLTRDSPDFRALISLPFRF